MICTFEENQLLIKPEGKIMMDHSDQIKNEIKALIQSKKEDSNIHLEGVLIDLSKIDFVDSTGVGVFISLYKFSVEKDFQLTLLNPTPMVDKVFTITKLGQIINIQSN